MEGCASANIEVRPMDSKLDYADGRKAYKKMSLQFHSDKNPACSAEAIKKYHAMRDYYAKWLELFDSDGIKKPLTLIRLKLLYLLKKKYERFDCHFTIFNNLFI